MIFGESASQENARNDFTESLIETWYQGLESPVRERWGVSLADVVRTAMDAEDDYYMAMSTFRLAWIKNKEGEPFVSAERAHDAMTAMKSWDKYNSVADAVSESSYPHLALLAQKEKELFASCNGMDEEFEMSTLVTAAREEAKQINYLVKPPRAYAV